MAPQELELTDIVRDPGVQKVGDLRFVYGLLTGVCHGEISRNLASSIFCWIAKKGERDK